LYYFLLILMASMALIVSGCASTAVSTSSSKTFSVSLVVAPDANPDHQGRPSPVIVKIYQLKALNTFQKTEFFSLLDAGKTVLEDDLLSYEERELQPGMDYEYVMDVDSKVQYIAVVAEFRNFEKSRWRATVKVPEKSMFDFIKSQILQVKVESLSVSASFIEP
ncbi:MAG TPA: type VI secretion system lipoprotein TssJ, partial [Thiomicrorhabdus sp.]|nr:type VI secretion system lipoprotein TssJ [Thiomicrorhabdus sp.]